MAPYKIYAELVGNKIGRQRFQLRILSVCYQAVMLLALKNFLLYFQPIDRPLLANQQSRLLSFNTVERI